MRTPTRNHSQTCRAAHERRQALRAYAELMHRAVEQLDAVIADGMRERTACLRAERAALAELG